jgi:hypothetical protein
MTSYQYITYHDHGFTLKQKTKYNNFISLDTEVSVKGIKSLIVRYDNISTVIDKAILKSCLKTIKSDTNLWEYLDTIYQQNQGVYNLNYKDDFSYGFCSYIAFYYLLQNKHFVDQLPFKFTLPCELEDGNFCEFNKMNFMVLPLNTILTIIPKNGLIYHFLQRCHQFIITWSSLFHVGPLLSYNLLHQLNYDIVVGVSRYNTHRIDDLTENMKTMKASLQDLKSFDDQSFIVDPTKDDLSYFKPTINNILQPVKNECECTVLKFKEDDDFTSQTDDKPILKLKPYIYC